MFRFALMFVILDVALVFTKHAKGWVREGNYEEEFEDGHIRGK